MGPSSLQSRFWNTLLGLPFLPFVFWAHTSQKSEYNAVHICHLLGILSCSHHIWSNIWTFYLVYSGVTWPHPPPVQPRTLLPHLPAPFHLLITQHLRWCQETGVLLSLAAGERTELRGSERVAPGHMVVEPGFKGIPGPGVWPSHPLSSCFCRQACSSLVYSAFQTVCKAGQFESLFPLSGRLFFQIFARFGFIHG